MPVPEVFPLSRQRWLAHVSHELRGALAAAELCIVALERGGRESSDLRAWAADIRSQLERAELAIEDLDQLRGVRPGGVREFSPVPIKRLIERRLRSWTRLAALWGRRLQVDWHVQDANVSCDVRRICQALDNLVSNSLRHAPGPVCVVVGREGASIVIRVTDGGQGPPDAARPAPTLARHGHGLAITRRAVIAGGGRLVCDGGTTAIALPLGEAGLSAGAADPAVDETSDNARPEAALAR